MSNTEQLYRDLLIRMVESFDYDEREWPIINVIGDSGYAEIYRVNDGMADLITEIRETITADLELNVHRLYDE